MNRTAPRLSFRPVAVLLAALLLTGPALADEAKARARLDRARELEALGSTDVARWLRELRSARQALQGVDEGTREEVFAEIDALVATGMDRHFEKARALANKPGGLKRADLYYFQPAERALKDYADEANRIKYGALIAELRGGAEPPAAEAPERTTAPKPFPPPEVEAPATRAGADPEPSPNAPPVSPQARPAEGSEAADGVPPTAPESPHAEAPALPLIGMGLGVVVLLMLGVLVLGASRPTPSQRLRDEQ